jgi:hypothetical protein
MLEFSVEKKGWLFTIFWGTLVLFLNSLKLVEL